MTKRRFCLSLVVFGLTVICTLTLRTLMNLSSEEMVPMKSYYDDTFEENNRHDEKMLTPLDSDHVNVVGSVVFVWCSGDQLDRQFEFRHYLSVLSVVRHLDADNVYFYYNREPEVDKMRYNTWLSDISEQFPFFHKRNMTSTGCSNSSTVPERQFIEQVIADIGGGIYVREDVILMRSAIVLRSVRFIEIVDEQNVLLLLSSDVEESKNNVSDISERVNSTTRHGVTLSRLQQLSPSPMVNHTRGNASILVTNQSVAQDFTEVAGGLFLIADRRIHPQDLWELDGELGRLLRTVAYGIPDEARPQPSYDQLVPNIAHVVWIGGGKMNFLFYLTVLSLLNVAMVDTVYVHGDSPPGGDYWQLVQNDPRIKIVRRNVNPTIYGIPTNPANRAHLSDLWRVDLMIRYGGIYVDTDAIFVRPVPRRLRGYEAVVSKDIRSLPSNGPFPDIYNFGVTIGKRNAEFWRRFQREMKHFVNKDWTWNGLRIPYKIKERHPRLLLVDDHLQVICSFGDCIPTWWQGYRTGQFIAGSLNWTTDAIAFHWTYPVPKEFADVSELLKTNGTWADIGRYVLAKSGVLELFKRPK